MVTRACACASADTQYGLDCVNCVTRVVKRCYLSNACVCACVCACGIMETEAKLCAVSNELNPGLNLGAIALVFIYSLCPFLCPLYETFLSCHPLETLTCLFHLPTSHGQHLNSKQDLY